ncbi:unnamed protein product [Phytophthora fragariaefolia]|uniref:Unnamed protein product n=1 Tax=Phytophthora fragariaefolia TaxID=1490495 RepID=A0A9W6TTH7_9STRA|nr:unnamed protein product [Phytophthora fragariaefolia]
MASEVSRDMNGVVSGTALHINEQLYILVNGVAGDVDGDVEEFSEALKAGGLTDVVVIRPDDELNASSLLDEAVIANAKKAINACRGSEILKNPSDPFYPVIREYRYVVSTEPRFGLPPDRGVHQESDLVPGTKYCGMRQ